MSNTVKPTRIISGGQRGADQGGLEAGKELGIETGGYAPRNWVTEVGNQPKLLQSFGLIECSTPGYPFRTKRNVQISSGTIIFGNISTPGSSLTINLCRELDKPYLINPTKEELLEFIDTWPIKILNIAGNRESKNPGIQKRVRNFLVEVLK